MTDPSKRDLERRVDNLDGGGPPELSATEAYALLVAVASGTASDEERRRWERVPEEMKESLVGELHDEIMAGTKSAHED